MADTVYEWGMTSLVGGDIDWEANDIYVALIDTADYTLDSVNDQFLSDIPAPAIVATSGVLANRVVTAGVATADDASFSSVTGDTCEALVVYQYTGVDATSRLIAYIDSAAGLPLTPSGGDVTVAWTGGVVFYLSGLQPSSVPTVVADETERLALTAADGELVWQTDTNELYIYADGATPSWELVYPATSSGVTVVADSAARLILDAADGDLVWQTDTNELHVYADAATPVWELVYPVPTTSLSIDNPDLWGTNLGYDEEFNDFSSSLPDGWQWQNQSTSTFSQSFGKGIIAAPAVSGTQWRGIVRPVPTPSSYELVTKMSWTSRAGSEVAVGLGFQDSGTNLLTFYWYSLNGTNETYLVSWTNYSGGGPSVKAGPVVTSPIGMPQYLRIRKNSSTSYDFAYSHDGVMWYTLISGYNVSAVLTPVNVGFMGYNSANYAWNMGLEWFRVRNIGWTPTP